jgi:hypothetical protein
MRPASLPGTCPVGFTIILKPFWSLCVCAAPPRLFLSLPPLLVTNCVTVCFDREFLLSILYLEEMYHTIILFRKDRNISVALSTFYFNQHPSLLCINLIYDSTSKPLTVTGSQETTANTRTRTTVMTEATGTNALLGNVRKSIHNYMISR